jgi:DNA-binding response OmpR family regulator
VPVAGEEILVVEDDAQVARLIQHFLSREGYRVQVAPDGRVAEELLELAWSLGSLPALVILDVHLPFQDGFQVLRRIREQFGAKRAAAEGKATTPIRVMMLSVQARDEDIVRALELGAMDYLGKPFSIDVLCAKVQSLLRWEPRE